MWFKTKKDEGVVHPEFSVGEGITDVTIALTLTAVCSFFYCGLRYLSIFVLQAECVIDEWRTGEHVDVPFSAAVYQDKFLAHLKRLEDFHENTKSLDIMPRLRKHMLKKARCVSRDSSIFF